MFCSLTSSTISSYRGLFMKLSTEKWAALEVAGLARSVRSWWVITTSYVSLRLAIAALVTLTSGNPAALILFRSTEAPIALEPMPASHANTMFLMGPARTAVPTPPPPPAPAPVSIEETELFLPFISSILDVASFRSTSSLCLVVFRITEATRKETEVASTTERITPT